MLLPSVVVVNIISYTWREVHVLDLYTMILYKVIVIIGQQGGKYHGFDGGKKDKSLPGRGSAPRLGGLDISETRSSWINCALRDDEAVNWVSIGH